MTRRTPLLLLLSAATLLLQGCTGGRPGEEEKPHVAHHQLTGGGKGVLFDVGDPRGDDRGTGRYEYPTSFQGRFGFLDVTRFRVLDSGSFVTFLVEFRRPIPRRRDDGSTEAKGYWLQLVDIYIDTDGKEESGRRWAMPGRNVRFDERSGWEKVVVATPGHSRSLEQLIRNRTSDLQLVDARNDIVIPNRIYAQAYDLKIVVPKAELGGSPQPDWGYQVLAMTYQPGNLSRNQLENGRVVRFPDDNNFGGGDDGEGDPNVIDLLAPTAEEQYRWLSNYRSSTYQEQNRLAVIPMIRAGQAPAAAAPVAAAPAPAPGPPAPVRAAAPVAAAARAAPELPPLVAPPPSFAEAPARVGDPSPAASAWERPSVQEERRAAPPPPPRVARARSGWERPSLEEERRGGGAAVPDTGGEEPEFSFDFSPLPGDGE